MEEKRKWYQKKRTLFLGLALIIFLIISLVPKLPVMVFLPGDVSKINSIIEIEGQYESEGEYYSNSVMVITKPSPFVYYFTKLFQNSEEFDITETEQILSNDELNATDKESKKNSIYQALIVAYNQAGKPLDYDTDGVIVAFIDPLVPTYQKLEIGDVIIGVNGNSVDGSSGLTTEIAKISNCDNEVIFKVVRNKEEKIIKTKLYSTESGCKIGISIYEHYVFHNPDFKIVDSSGQGGSAGLLQALMIYDKLTEKDMTYGKKISGTGGIDINGQVTPIGGIKQKVMGAIKGDIDIYFAPDLDVAEGNLYQIALSVKKEMKSDIIIVPVKTIEDAINYLNTTFG